MNKKPEKPNHVGSDSTLRERLAEAVPLMVDSSIFLVKWVIVLNFLHTYVSDVVLMSRDAESFGKVAGLVALGALLTFLGARAEQVVEKRPPEPNHLSIIFGGAFWPWGIADGSTKLVRSAVTGLRGRRRGNARHD